MLWPFIPPAISAVSGEGHGYFSQAEERAPGPCAPVQIRLRVRMFPGRAIDVGIYFSPVVKETVTSLTCQDAELRTPPGQVVIGMERRLEVPDSCSKLS